MNTCHDMVKASKKYLLPRIKFRGREFLISLGFDFYQTDRWYRGNDDRRFLETQILPWYACRPEFQTIVFTGCQWYTRGYRRLFKGCRWIGMEVDEDCARRYGGANHVAGSCSEPLKHFEPNSLDLVLFTSV